MEGELNPFAPPRVQDGEAASPGGAGGAIPAEALRQLTRSAPWATFTAVATVATLVLSVTNSLITATRAQSAYQLGSAFGSLAIGAVIGLIQATLLWRCGEALRSLAAGEPRALERVATSQRALFKTMGVLTIVGLGLVFLGLAVGVMLATRKLMVP